MQKLRVTMIDVGWGDSLLVETGDSELPDGSSNDDKSGWKYALIDCNDTFFQRSSSIYLKRFFERVAINAPTTTPLFDWVLLSHVHADHGQGLKRLLRMYGTQQLWHPDSQSQAVYFTELLRYANRTPARVVHFQPIDNTLALPVFGAVTMQVLWPPPGHYPINENNNSVVLLLSLGQVSFVLGGDAEADGVWGQISAQLPTNTGFFKVPHHGSANGVFDQQGQTPWLNRLGTSAHLGISSHLRPFAHPATSVVQRLDQQARSYFRTDKGHHLSFETDGNGVTVSHSHV